MVIISRKTRKNRPILMITKLWACVAPLQVYSTCAANKKTAHVSSFLLAAPTKFEKNLKKRVPTGGACKTKKPALLLGKGVEGRGELSNLSTAFCEPRTSVNKIKRNRGKRVYNFPDAFLMKKFINLLMVAGKKSVAYKIFCAAGFEFLQTIEKKRKIKKVATPSGTSGTQVLPGLLPNTPGLGPQSSLTKSACASIPANPAGRKQLKRFYRKGQKKREKAGHRNRNRFLLKMRTVIRNVQPSVEGRKCRLGRSHKWVPAIVPHKRGCSLAMRWIIESARKRKKSSKLPMHRCLAQEFLDAYQKGGRPRQRRDELNKLCEGNRGFLRYRWW